MARQGLLQSPSGNTSGDRTRTEESASDLKPHNFLAATLPAGNQLSKFGIRNSSCPLYLMAIARRLRRAITESKDTAAILPTHRVLPEPRVQTHASKMRSRDQDPASPDSTGLAQTHFTCRRMPGGKSLSVSSPTHWKTSSQASV